MKLNNTFRVNLRKKLVAFIAATVVTLSLTSCSQSKFEKVFECETPMYFSNTKTYTDVQDHFEFDVPKYWKTKLYYDEYQSKLYTADTTRELSKSYIIDITWHQGELVFDDTFEDRVSEQVAREYQLIPVMQGSGEFLDKEGYYHISTGKANNLSWHYLQIYLRHNVDEYYTLTSKIYGDELVSERICASLALFKGLKFKD